MNEPIPLWLVDDSGNRYDLPEGWVLDGTPFSQRVNMQPTLYKHGGRDVSDGKLESRTFSLKGRLWSAHGTQAYWTQWRNFVVGIRSRDSYLALNPGNYWKVQRIQLPNHTFLPAHMWDVVMPVAKVVLAEPWEWYGDPFLEPTTSLLFDCDAIVSWAGANKIMDKSAHSNHGTVNAAGPVIGASKSGFFSCLVYTDADQNEEVLVPTNGVTELNWGAGDFTMECWVNMGAASQGTLLSKTNNADTVECWVRIDNNGNVAFHIHQAANQATATSAGTDYRGAWHHFLVQKEDGGDIEVFVDGVEVADADASGVGSLDHNEGFRVGHRSAGTTDVPTASIDQVRVLTRSIDDTYIGQLYRIGYDGGPTFPDPWTYQGYRKTFVTIAASPQSFNVVNNTDEAMPTFYWEPTASCHTMSLTNVTDNNALWGYQDLDLNNGTTLVVDSSLGSVERDGTATLRLMSGQFLRLLGNTTNSIKYTGDAATGRLEARYRARVI